MQNLNQEIISHWKQLRQMTYDFLDSVTDADLSLRLPFARSQTLGNQFYCMLGTTETFANYLPSGKWEKWECSLNDGNPTSKSEIISQLKKSDDALIKVLEQTDLLSYVGKDETPLTRYMVLVEHESHHQGQIINFIYAHDLEIPTSWVRKWALRRN